MKQSYGYSSYRGRSKVQTALLILVVILLAVLLLSVCAFFFLQRYMVYTDDGQARLELPFFTRETPAPEPTWDTPITIVTAQPTVEPEPEETPAPVKLPAIAPVSLFRAAVTENNAAQLVAAKGGNAALLNMKANDGSLGYVSSLPLAVSLGTSSAEPGLNDQIQAITAGELYTIARISCFRDNLAPKVDQTLAIKSIAGYNWRDAADTRWLNPTVAEARQYVVNLCTEVAELGFDELLLDNSGFPVTGNLEQIRVDEAEISTNFTETVENFYREVKNALGEREVVLSISVSAAELQGTSSHSGQTAALLGTYADRVYVLGAENVGECDPILAEVGLTGNRVVYVDNSVEDLSTTGKLMTAK